MKKLFVLLLLSLLIDAVFCTEVYNSGTSNGGNDAFVVYGYYNPAAIEKVITLKIKLPNSSTTVANTGSINWSRNNANFKNVFTWEATGNFTGKMSIEFTITPLQAELFGYYFIPEHTIKSSLGNGSELEKDENSIDFSAISEGSSVYSVSFNENQYPSRQNITKSIKYVCTNKTAPNNGSWTETGTFALKVTKYNELYGGTFNYVSDVIVVLTVDAVEQQGGS